MHFLPSLLLALAAAGDTTAQRDTATYASAGLRALVAEAVEINRRVPPGLGGYRAHLESEISIGNRRAQGMEMSVSLEQVASTLTWDRTPPAPEMPHEIVAGTRARYVEAYERIVGRPFADYVEETTG